jgi:hypothetical protein
MKESISLKSVNLPKHVVLVLDLVLRGNAVLLMASVGLE